MYCVFPVGSHVTACLSKYIRTPLYLRETHLQSPRRTPHLRTRSPTVAALVAFHLLGNTSYSHTPLVRIQHAPE